MRKKATERLPFFLSLLHQLGGGENAVAADEIFVAIIVAICSPHVGIYPASALVRHMKGTEGIKAVTEDTDAEPVSSLFKEA